MTALVWSLVAAGFAWVALLGVLNLKRGWSEPTPTAVTVWADVRRELRRLRAAIHGGAK